MSALLASAFELGTFNPEGGTVPAAAQANLRDLHAVLLQVQAVLGGAPLIVTSGYRDPAHNVEVGGVPQSQHLDGSAADVVVQGMELPVVARRIRAAITRGDLALGQVIYYPTELAPGVNKGHVHIGLPNRDSHNRQLIHLGGNTYVDLNPANWPAYAQLGVGAGLVALLAIALLLLGHD